MLSSNIKKHPWIASKSKKNAKKTLKTSFKKQRWKHGTPKAKSYSKETVYKENSPHKSLRLLKKKQSEQPDIP